MTERPVIRARVPLPPLRRWILRGVLLGAIVLAPYLATYSQPAPELGITANGGLQPCSQSPNCVGSEWSYILASNTARLFNREQPPRSPHFVPPIELADDSPSQWKELLEVVRRQPGLKVVESTDRYVHAERRTTIYGLIDDFELMRLMNGTVLIRSAARIAYADFGRNRRFVEQVRNEFDHRPREQWF